MATTARELFARRRWPAEMFATNLRARRGALGLTYDDVADRLRQIAPVLLGPDHDMATSVGKVRNIMKGSNHPKLPEIPVWAAALETNPGYLLGFSKDEGPDPDLPSPTGTVAAHTPGLLNQQVRRLTLVPNTGTSLPQTVRRLSAVPDR